MIISGTVSSSIIWYYLAFSKYYLVLLSFRPLLVLKIAKGIYVILQRLYFLCGFTSPQGFPWHTVHAAHGPLRPAGQVGAKSRNKMVNSV